MLWLDSVLRHVRDMRQELANGSYIRKSIKDAEFTGRAISAFVGTYGPAMRPESIAMVEAITSHLVFLGTVESGGLQEELNAIEGLTRTLWNDIRGEHDAL